MSKLYKLPCSCGLFISIDTNQAGRQIECRCGKTLSVPTMSEIIRLEPYSDEENRKAAKNKSATSSASSSSFSSRKINLGLILKTIGLILFFVAGFFLFYFGKSYPTLNDVCKIQRYFMHAGRVVGRDTQPISERDLMLVSSFNPQTNQSIPLTEDLIHEIQDPFYLIQLHDHFKGGPELSYNFHEKYDKLVFYYWTKIIVVAVVLAAAVFLFITGLCQPKYTPDIGEREGESWE